MYKQSGVSTQYLSILFLGISLISLLILSILTFSFSSIVVSFPFQKGIVGSLFIIICLIGILLGVFPSKCSGILHFRTSNGTSQKENTKVKMTEGKFSGHHPNCNHFNAHVFHTKNTTLCAGCTGLIIGAIISIVGSFFYFFLDVSIEYDVFIFFLGFVGVIFGLLQYCLPHMNRSKAHLFLNVTFVFGAFLLLIGVDEITHSFFLEVYLLFIILFWIITRITLSQFEHKRICAVCDIKKCIYL